jgi:hypothetical protein
MEIEAIPTEYAGVLFRSKLEATWARFFDVIGLEWEYEPCQMYGWWPDFLIAGWWLAEVKPLNVISTEAMHSPVYEKAIRPFDTVLLGDGPGDALGLVVRRTKAGEIFPRYLFADIDDGPAQLSARRLWPVGYQYPLVQIWRGVVATADTWEAPPFRKVVMTAFDECTRGDA